jgi:hypothetical protein
LDRAIVPRRHRLPQNKQSKTHVTAVAVAQRSPASYLQSALILSGIKRVGRVEASLTMGVPHLIPPPAMNPGGVVASTTNWSMAACRSSWV